ncbi:MAG: hypothetical protein AAGA81_00880 [Acidobacteriota bacterium]
MEVPSAVLVHNPTLNLKGTRADLIRISDEGYYEMNVPFGEKTHRVLLPIPETVVIQLEPEETGELDFEIER